ncbi:hypothetical protein [Lentzea albidocapillata]|uniref:hypothetical protein n=1 Tax=Lentzea albidocapillata TaxID=40571 RepID=UPI00115FD3FE|nr:hypothetical protein [Lentzea albidocapillata]
MAERSALSPKWTLLRSVAWGTSGSVATSRYDLPRRWVSTTAAPLLRVDPQQSQLHQPMVDRGVHEVLAHLAGFGSVHLCGGDPLVVAQA